MSGYRQRLSVLRAGLGILHGSRAFGGPIQASVDITCRCNIRCVHCYYHSPHVALPNLPEVRLARIVNGELPQAESLREQLRAEADGPRLHALLEGLLDLGTRRFQFSGNGEIFTHPEMLEFIARVKARGSFCVANTNGTLLDRDRMDRLLALGFDELRLSLLAGKKEVYNRTHPGIGDGMFDSIRANLLYLADRRRALGVKRPVVSLVTVIMSHNADDLMGIARLAADVDAGNVIYRMLDDVGDPGLRRLALSAEQRAEARRQFREAERFLDERGIGHNIPNILQVASAQLDTTEFHSIVPCYYGWLAARIGVDGEVRPCCRCYASMGNAFERPFKEIWFGETYRQFRQQALALPKRGTPVPDCDCYSCVHHNANLRVYKALHPMKQCANRSRLSVLGDGAGTD